MKGFVIFFIRRFYVINFMHAMACQNDTLINIFVNLPLFVIRLKIKLNVDVNKIVYRFCFLRVLPHSFPSFPISSPECLITHASAIKLLR